ASEKPATTHDDLVSMLAVIRSPRDTFPLPVKRGEGGERQRREPGEGHLPKWESPSPASLRSAPSPRCRGERDNRSASRASLRHRSERLLEPRRVTRPDLRIEHARDRLAVERRQHLLGR